LALNGSTGDGGVGDSCARRPVLEPGTLARASRARQSLIALTGTA
jgi:hypothetical protein